jgi:hypothetical protein
MASSVTMKAKGALPIGREQVGVEFIAREDGAQVGELTVSKGGVRWRTARAQDGKANDRLLTWKQLDSLIAGKPRQ